MWTPNQPFEPSGNLILKGAMREIAVPKPRNEEHPPVAVQQADNQHRNATEELMSIPKPGAQLIDYPSQADYPKQIDDEKAALVEDVLEADFFTCFQFIMF
jgi:hypothetical protein